MSDTNNQIVMCSINICGMSERSKILLDHYVHKKGFDVVKVQETNTCDEQRLKLTNMTQITDNNKAQNKGAALYINDKFSISKLDEICQQSNNIDATWGLAFLNSKRYILGTVYMKRNYNNAIEELMKMLNKAHSIMNKLKVNGIILTGDLNARHVSWGDNKNDSYGNKLATSLDRTKFSIVTPNSPTFLSKDGCSVIDLSIVTNNLVDKVVNCITDEDVELFSGAPFRGHVPVIITLNLNGPTSNKQTIEKIDLDSIDWQEWSKDLDELIGRNKDYLDNVDDPDELGAFIDKVIQTVTAKHGVKKTVSIHSKPFWTPELDRLCKEMRKARKRYNYRNTDDNERKFKEAKDIFDEARKQECQKFLLQKTNNLNNVQKQKFWKEFKKIFKINTKQTIDPLMDNDGSFLSSTAEIEEKMFNTFFQGDHLKEADFDETFYHEVNRIFDDIMKSTEEPGENLKDLNSNITVAEIKAAIKTYHSSGKSSDKQQFNPKMFKHLGVKVLGYIEKLANLCLNQGKWFWSKAEVIFLRKSGKKSYAIPGSYRPISISPYIGKLIEKIIANRIQKFLTLLGLHDPDQEGFMDSRNTIRYLNRLILDIQTDIQKKLTSICLFIDFEKAFDSVWKKGLIVKLYQLGIRGKILHLIKDFLFNRKINININGVVGNIRETSEVGLPQGSALSPILFRIYVMDLVADLSKRKDITLLKFADDGTVKASAESTALCVEKMNTILSTVEQWSKKNRMVINCMPNKTEVIGFSTAENNMDLIPDSFTLGYSTIKRVHHTKVLGLIIDEKLNFDEHSKSVYNKLLGIWATICKHSNRHWGFKQHTLIQIIKVLWLPTLFYAGHLWITAKNTKEINSLFYKLCKSTIGAVFNIRQSVAEVIVGIPPILITNEVNKVKHFLKVQLSEIPEDRLKNFLQEELKSSNQNVVHSTLRPVYKFLKWKVTQYPQSMNASDKEIIMRNIQEEFFSLSKNSCKYTKAISDKYTEYLWKHSIQNEFQVEGFSSIPIPRCLPLPINTSLTREVEVAIMSILYENNLLNDFLHKINPVDFASPLCRCETDRETTHHILFHCPFVEAEIRTNAFNKFKEICGNSAYCNSYIDLLNASRNKEFMTKVVQIIDCQINNKLRTNIIL